MTSGEGNPSEPVRSNPERHEEFLELCALSTTGSLSVEEQETLQSHLATCPRCREAVKEFEAVVDEAVPALAPELAGEITEDDPSFAAGTAEAVLRKRLSEQNRTKRDPDGNAFFPILVPRNRNFLRRLDQIHFWLPLAAGAVLCVTLGIMAYRIGLHRGVDGARLGQGSRDESGAGSASGALEAAMRERDTANARLAERDESLSELRSQISSQSAEIAKLRAAQSDQLHERQTSDEDKKQLVKEKDHLLQELSVEQAALQASQKQLDALQQQRSGELLRAAGLEAKVAELSRAVDDQARTTEEQRELLSHDRDIRELMGARDLYVAEVYDIARTGEKQKAFGRLFYTKGKSLIFYAYDLDAEPQWKDADTFQAWGTHGRDRSQAFNLGMFYEDNVSKKRWVLKYDDRKTLQQIDAVFVTVEPHGGSEKPSGKPFLYAYLKMNANHP
jgi:predicted  nucleic acid-binding Zn-ribbon protein